MNALIGLFLPGIDNYAHLGGFVAGLMVGTAFPASIGDYGGKETLIKRFALVFSALYLSGMTVGAMLIKSSSQCFV